ncbi:MAG: hypothetical protein GWO02_07700 [Gammaproteobacteria bacterium]|nr:hypothetical protein [Gammaproteobacteria bacterium]
MGFRKVNATYKPNIARAARWINWFTYRDVVDKRYIVHVPGLYRNRGKILEFLNRLPLGRPTTDPSAVLGRRIVEHIRGRYAATNRELARERDLPLEDYGYPC